MIDIGQRAQKATASEQAPETGQIGWFDVVVSDVEHWVEHGDFVFRSASQPSRA